MSDAEVRAMIRTANRDWSPDRNIRLAQFHSTVEGWAGWPAGSDHERIVAICELLAIYEEAEQAVMAS